MSLFWIAPVKSITRPQSASAISENFPPATVVNLVLV